MSSLLAANWAWMSAGRKSWKSAREINPGQTGGTVTYINCGHTTQQIEIGFPLVLTLLYPVVIAPKREASQFRHPTQMSSKTPSFSEAQRGSNTGCRWSWPKPAVLLHRQIGVCEVSSSDTAGNCQPGKVQHAESSALFDLCITELSSSCKTFC